MGHRQLEIFMAKKDEDDFIRYWLKKGVVVLYTWPKSRARPQPIKRAPATNYLDRKTFYILRLSMLSRVARDARDRTKIDPWNSDVICYHRGIVHTGTIGLGNIIMRTWNSNQESTRLTGLWDELKDWLDSTYFRLPKGGGYLGTGALLLATKKKEVASSKHIYLIRRDSSKNVIAKVVKP